MRGSSGTTETHALPITLQLLRFRSRRSAMLPRLATRRQAPRRREPICKSAHRPPHKPAATPAGLCSPSTLFGCTRHSALRRRTNLRVCRYYPTPSDGCQGLLAPRNRRITPPPVQIGDSRLGRPAGGLAGTPSGPSRGQASNSPAGLQVARRVRALKWRFDCAAPAAGPNGKSSSPSAVRKLSSGW